MQGFIFGGNTGVPTVEALKKRREIADMLAQQSVAGTPRNVGEGIAAVGQALASRYLNHKLGPQEEAEKQRIADALAGLTGGGYSGGGFTGAGMGGMDAPAAQAPAGTPVAPAAGGPQGYRDAIASIESSGNYGAMGPVTKSGDRAYGKYQVMGANIPEWTQAALGRSVTPEEFLANPEIQDKVFDHTFGGYVDQYGPEGAASMWFSGDPTPDGSSDQLGTSDSDYVAKFMAGLGGGGGMGGGQPDMAKISQIAEILSNPYADPGQKMVAEMLIKREMESGGGGGMTPYQAAQIGLDNQRLQLERERMQVDSRGEYGLAPVWGTDAEGNPSLVQLGRDGQPIQPQMPEGFEISNKPIEIDGGTHTILLDPQTRQPIGMIPKDLAGAEREKELGQASGKAAASLGDRGVMVQSAIDQIGRITADPELPNVLGNIQGRLPPRTQAQANLQTQIDGLQGKVFANAIAALVGLGAMSNMEGQAVTQSLAALSQIQDEGAYTAELNRLSKLLTDKLAAAEALAGQGAPPAAPAGIPQSAIDAGIDPDLWQFMSPEDQALWRN